MEVDDRKSETSGSRSSAKMSTHVEKRDLGEVETGSSDGQRQKPKAQNFFATLDSASDVQEGVQTEWKGIGRYRASLLMMKTQIGIGALGIPGSFISLGMIPATIVLVLTAVFTTWSNYQIGLFKLAHPDVYNLEGAMSKIFGRWAGYCTSVVLLLYYIFTAASAVVSISTCLNVISGHATCTTVFVAVATILATTLSSIKTLNKLTWVAPIGLGFILVAIFMTMIAVGVQDHPDNYTGSAPFVSDWVLFNPSPFTSAMAAVSSIIFSFTGTPYFFNIHSEMHDPEEDYSVAMFACQAVVFTVYYVVGVVVYYYCGSYSASPALGSTTEIVMKVGYGIALPGLAVTGMIVHHMPSKDIFMLILRRPERKHHINQKTKVHYLAWYGSVVTVGLFAYIIANAIPEFGSLISLIGALFGTLIVLPPYAAMYFYRMSEKGRTESQNSGGKVTPKPSPMMSRLGAAWAILIFIVGIYCTIFGTWGALAGIVKAYKNSSGATPWSCGNNTSK